MPSRPAPRRDQKDASAPSPDAHLARQEPRNATPGHHGVDQPLGIRNLPRRQPQNVHAGRALAAPRLEPVQERRLAVAARPHQNDVVRRRSATRQIVQASTEHRLFRASPNEGRGQRTIAGDEEAWRFCTHCVAVVFTRVKLKCSINVHAVMVAIVAVAPPAAA